MLSLATQTNSTPLPSVPEAYGVRLPPPSDCLTAVDFDLTPNRPPPGVQLFDEEIEEVEESESDEDMEPSLPPPAHHPAPRRAQEPQPHHAHPHPHVPVPAVAHTPAGSDVDMLTPGAGAGDLDGSDGEEDDGLFAGGDEEEEESGDEAMEDVTASGAGDANGMKRKLVEEEDYD